MSSAGLLTLALLLPAAPPAGPKLQRGDELIYTGSVSEAVDRPGMRFRRTHELEVRVFVFERRENWADAAVLTLLRRTDDAPVAGVLPEVTGVKRANPSPPAARLDLVRIHEDGTVHLLAPLGPAPLRFASDTPARALPTLPLDGFAPFEFGMFPPRPKSDEKTWSVATTNSSLIDETWSLKGHDFINNERCVQLQMVQRSSDWEKPRGGLTSWQRVDDIWTAQNGLARRVHRAIRHRDGIAPEAAVRIEVKFELQEQGRPIGRTYDRYRLEIETAYLAAAEMAPLFKDAARLGAEPFKQRIARLDEHLAATEPGTPYREAVLAVRRQLDAARRGEAISLPTLAPELPFLAPRIAMVGLAAPDFTAGKFRLSEVQGKPVVLIFFMPGQETTERSLTIAEAVQQKFGSRIAVVPLSVFAKLEAGMADRDRLKLAVPVYDGTAAETAYGIESFPRFFAIDASGKLRWTFTGVGPETGYLLREQVDSLLSPPVATGSPGGPSNPKPLPRP